MATLYELRVVAGHRFNELSIRLRNGKKVWVGKDKAVVVGSDELAKGEEFTIERYQKEGRMIVVKTEPEAETDAVRAYSESRGESEAKARPKAKRVRKVKAGSEV